MKNVLQFPLTRTIFYIFNAFFLSVCGTSAPDTPQDRNQEGAKVDDDAVEKRIETKLGSACPALDENWETLPSSTLVIVEIAATVDSGKVDSVGSAIEGESGVITSGDAVIKKAWGRAVILDRFDNTARLLSSTLQLEKELSLPDCNPHDFETINDCTALLSCYNHDEVLVIDRETFSISNELDLSSFSDASMPGQIDQMIRVGNTTYIALQRLDASFLASNDSFLVAVDNTRLEVLDADPLADGVQAYTLPCRNPFSNMSVFGGQIAIACAGDFINPQIPSAVVGFDLQNKTFTTIAEKDVLDGNPTGLVSNSSGIFVSVAKALNDEATEWEHKILRLGLSSPVVVLHSVQGFRLAGLSAAQNGTVYFGDRGGPPEDIGLWTIFDGSDTATGPIVLDLPPSDLAAF